MCSFQRDKSDGRGWNRNLLLQPRQLASGFSRPLLRRWGRAFGESRSAPPWLLRLEKDKYSGSARGMRFPHESNRRCVRARKARVKRKPHRNQPAQKHATPQQIRRPDLDLPVLSSAQIRATEQAAFARGVQVEALMDDAGAGVAQTVTKFFPRPGKCIVFAGKGNNAGDALVAADRLRRLGWKIEVWLAFKEDDYSELMRKKLAVLQTSTPRVPDWTDEPGHDIAVTILELFAYAADELSFVPERIAAERYLGTAAPLIILDGLLGVAADPPLREPIRAACRSINQLR